jgi:hypothetical protein
MAPQPFNAVAYYNKNRKNPPAALSPDEINLLSSLSETDVKALVRIANKGGGGNARVGASSY